jgi:hypothetical protein
MSEAPNGFDWPESPPLDVHVFAQHVAELWRQECEEQLRRNGIREMRVYPNNNIYDGILKLVQQFDESRTRHMAYLKGELINFHMTTPRPSILMKLEDAARPFVMAERERCAKIADSHSDNPGYCDGLSGDCGTYIAFQIRGKQ